MKKALAVLLSVGIAEVATAKATMTISRDGYRHQQQGVHTRRRSSLSWLGLPLGAARAHDVVYGDVVVLRSPAAAGESLETTRVPVCERRLLNQKGSRRSATHPPHHAG